MNHPISESRAPRWEPAPGLKTPGSVSASDRSEFRPADTCGPASHRRGLTLIELLVSIAIIGVLFGLLLTAVQTVRETARRAQCVSNLRQLGIAMNAYHSLHNMFPSSVLMNSRHYSTNCLSELVFLLPHVEAIPLYNSINMAFADLEFADVPSMENRTARNTRVALFLCPSDPEPHHMNSYRFNRGRFHVSGSMPYDGPFSIGVFPSASTVKDGLAHTAFVSERIGGSFIDDSHDSRSDVRVPIGMSAVITSDSTFIPFCLSTSEHGWMVQSGRYWFYAGFSYSHYNHNGVPNDPRPTCSSGPVGNWGTGGLAPPRAYHGGVHILLGDGHVNRIESTVLPRVWEALGTHDGGDF